jgi:hypothetical protein
MRSIARIALCTIVGLLAQRAPPAWGQMPKGLGPPATRTLDRVTIETMLQSSPGCARGGVSYANITNALTQIAANASCYNYVALVSSCPRGRLWSYVESRALPRPLWAGAGDETFGIDLQNELIAQARADAATIPAPAGTRLFRLTFATEVVGNGPLRRVVVTGTALYGVCFIGYPRLPR